MLIGITTAPRPNGVSYLLSTIDSLIESGSTEAIFVFSEPASGLHVSGCNTEVIWNKARLGNWKNWINAATNLVQWSKLYGDNYVLMCEDDVRFGSEPLSEIQMTLALLQDEYGDSTGPLLVYTSSVYQDRMEPGIKIIDSRSLCGSCAMLWPAAALKRVIECDRAKNWRGIGGQDSGAEIMHADTCIGMCCDDLGLRVYAARPCWAQHVGAVSSLHEFRDNPDMFSSHVKE